MSMSVRMSVSAAAGAVAALIVGAAAPARAGDPSVGVEFERKSGTWIDAEAGASLVLAGSRPVSNADVFGGFSLGRDFGARLAGFIRVGSGVNNYSCRAGTEQSGGTSCVTVTKPVPPTPPTTTISSDYFVLRPVEVGVRYRLRTWDATRLSLVGVGGAGVSLFHPGLTHTIVGKSYTVSETLGGHVLAGIGVDFDTRLEGLTVGAELAARVTFPAVVPSLTPVARLQYTF